VPFCSLSLTFLWLQYEDKQRNSKDCKRETETETETESQALSPANLKAA